MKLKTLLKERAQMPRPPEGIEIGEFVNDLVAQVARLYKTTRFKGWTADLDDKSGALEWTYKADPKLTVYATPFWENEPYVPVSVLYDGDEESFHEYPLKVRYYQANDISTYMQLMGILLPVIARKGRLD